MNSSRSLGTYHYRNQDRFTRSYDQRPIDDLDFETDRRDTYLHKNYNTTYNFRPMLKQSGLSGHWDRESRRPYRLPTNLWNREHRNFRKNSDEEERRYEDRDFCDRDRIPKNCRRSSQDSSRRLSPRSQIFEERLVDKLNRMKRVAAGNGVTQCVLCGSEFGLLGARSYAAMCHDCRRLCSSQTGIEILMRV
uniref:Uncharacterized protein n=1 Tax=Romanomermis culicivorax TaxID=13658 RepID=A0A915IHL2_ROMCU